MLSQVKYRNSNFTRIEKIKILSRPLNVKNKIALNIICPKKYTMPYSTVLEFIHQLSVLSHVKYRNSNITRIEKNLNII